MSNLKKILMVDDDLDLREALADQLVLTEDFDVFEATTGAEGLQKAKEATYEPMRIPFWVWMRARMIMCPSRSNFRCCWRGSGRNCGSMSSRKMRCSRSGHTRSNLH